MPRQTGRLPPGAELHGGDGLSAEIPRYRSFNEVKALQIARVEYSAAGPAIYFVDQRFGPLPAEPLMFARYTPVPGDYWLLYRDGDKSICPKAEFEAGYTAIFDDPSDIPPYVRMAQSSRTRIA
jgi:hypothetical protein